MDTVNDTNPPTDTPPPYRRPDRLTRATDDKVLGGVAGGLGRYFGIDPVVFRIAFVVLALAGGSGVLLYLLAWLLVPDDAGSLALPRIGHERTQKLLTAVLVGGGLLILFDQLGNRGHGDVPIGLVLVAVGALVLWSRRDGSGPGPTPPPPSGGGGGGGGVGGGGVGGRYVAPPPVAAPPAGTPVTPPPPPVEGSAEAFGEPPIAEGTAGSAAATNEMPALHVPTPAPAGSSPPPRAAPERKPRSSLVAVTLSLLAVLAGALSLVGVSPATGLALALLVTGAALIVGACRGRARWLLPVGLVLAVALAAASVIDVPIRGGTSDATFRPFTLADVHSPYRLAAGDLRLDLSALDLSGATVTVVASVAAGHLEVTVPPGAAVDLDAHVGAGNLQLLGRAADGLDVHRQVSEPGREGGGRLVLRARAGAGQVEVRRAQA